jgi:hypothetical protein
MLRLRVARRVHAAIVDVTRRAADADFLRGPRRLLRRVALGRVAAAAERERLDGVRLLEDVVLPRRAV